MSRIFPKGSLAISIASTIGKMGILNFDAALPDSLVMITPNQSIVDVGFLYWQFLYLRKYLEESATRAVNPNINLETFDPIELWIPSLIEQGIIDTHLTSIQKDTNQMVQQLEEDVLLLTETERSAREQAYGRIS